jgi:hypothetical protein
MRKEALAFRCLAHGKALSQDVKLAAEVGGMTLVEGAASMTKTYLLDDPRCWESFVGVGLKAPRVAPVPPGLAQIPIRPLVLDSASEYVVFPSLSHRAQQKQEKPTAFSRWFGLGKG